MNKQMFDAIVIGAGIVQPDAFVSPGFKRGVMPKTFGESLSGGQLADLVALLTER
jgi:hypothetical protein